MRWAKGIVVGLAGAEAGSAGYFRNGSRGMICAVGSGVGKTAIVDIREKAAELGLENLGNVRPVRITPFRQAGERQSSVQVSLSFLHLAADAAQ